MKKVLLITPIFLLLLSCSQYEDTAFKIGWMLDCPDEDKELCECEVDKLLEKYSGVELVDLIEEDPEHFISQVEEITMECNY